MITYPEKEIWCNLNLAQVAANELMTTTLVEISLSLEYPPLIRTRTVEFG